VSRSSVLVSAIFSALEALSAGDYPLVAAILDGALEDVEITDPAADSKCPHCGFRGWPGQVDHHLRFAHADEPTIRRAA
jgi:hypothetical protein